MAAVASGGVMPATSVISLYQKGETDPNMSHASILNVFAFAWSLIWVVMRCWEDLRLARREPDAAVVGSGKGRLSQ